MATNHGGSTILTRGVDLLETVAGGALRRLDGEPSVETETERPAATRSQNRRDDSRTDGASERLLTPEEHIVDAIERSGGSMRQSAIVDAVEWSESTVSRKLSELESRATVSRYQIGREKLVYLPGHEPAATESALVSAGAD